jgi:ribose transport system substrate-binding protein
VIAAAAAVVASLSLGACTTGTGAAVSTPGATSEDLADLSIGFFSPGTSNTYAATLTQAAVDKADELGVALTNQSANFDVQTQVNQLQQALQRRTYNAWIVVPLDPNQECSILEDAVAQGIAVMMANTPACNDVGPDGGVGLIGVQNAQAYKDWWNEILSTNEPGAIASVTGGALDYLTKVDNAALEEALAANPGFDVVSNQSLDYSTDKAYANAQAILQASPDLRLFASNYSGMTQGIIKAIDQAGLTGKVKVYDFNGDTNMVDAIEAGQVTMTVPGMPASEGAGAVQLLVDHWQGEDVPQVTDPLDGVDFPGAPFVTIDNAAEFTPEY